MRFTYPWQEAQVREIESRIEGLEKTTSVEFVVVFSLYSGNYNDAKHLCGLFLSLLTLMFMLFSEQIQFSPLIVPPILAVSHFLGFFLVHQFPILLKPFLSPERLHTNVLQKAQATFFSQNMHLTLDRTGLLVFISHFENRFEILLDAGIRQKVPIHEFQEKIQKFRDLQKKVTLLEHPERVCDLLSEVGEVMARYLPPTDENPDEIPNRPIFL